MPQRLPFAPAALLLLLACLLPATTTWAQKPLKGTYKLKSIELVDAKGNVVPNPELEIAEELEQMRIGYMQDGVQMVFDGTSNVQLMEEDDNTKAKYKMVGTNTVHVWMDDLTMKTEPDFIYTLQGKAIILYMPSPTDQALRYALRFAP